MMVMPHRLEGYMASNDPDFETTATEIIGLYLHPPQHAAVFCIDEKTAIQALDRKDPVLPLSPGRAERHGFEYLGMGRFLCMLRLTRRLASPWDRPRPATPRPTSLGFSPTLSLLTRHARS